MTPPPPKPEVAAMLAAKWVGFDFDGTLILQEPYVRPGYIGPAIEPMCALVRQYLAAGIEVRIFTARASCPDEEERLIDIQAIEDWCEVQFGRRLRVTCVKDMGCMALYDDRAYNVLCNSGTFIGFNSLDPLQL